MRRLALLLLLAAAPAGAQQQGSMKLNVGGRADDVIFEDVNNDGTPDIVVQSGADLRFFHFKNGSFAANPDAVLRLQANTFLWCFAKYTDSPSRVITVMGSRGISRHLPTQTGYGEPQDLIIMPNLFEGQRGENRIAGHVAFMRDLDGDGLDDAMLFDHDAVLVFPQRKGDRPDFRLAQRLEVPIETVLNLGWAPQMKVLEATTIPMLAFGDINADKRLDISYYKNEAIGVFFQQEGGRFSTEDPKDLAAKKQKPRNTFLKFEVPPAIKDLNGDGLPDIALTYPSKGKVQIYYNQSGRTDFTTPDETLQLEKSWSTGITVADLDGDGRHEIIMGVVRQLDILSGIEVFTTKKVSLELHIYRQRGKGLFTNEPVHTLAFSIPYTFQASRESIQIDLTFRPNVDCDLDGDGRRDLIVEKGPTAFAVHPGVQDTLLSTKPAYDIPLDPPKNVAFTKIYAADFNKDRKSDLVVRYRTVDEQRKDEIEVKISK